MSNCALDEINFTRIPNTAYVSCFVGFQLASPISCSLSLSLPISASFSVYVRMFSSLLFLVLLSSLSSLVFGFSCRLFTLDSNGRKVWLCWQRFEHMRVSATQENEFIREKSTWERILLFGWFCWLKQNVSQTPEAFVRFGRVWWFHIVKSSRQFRLGAFLPRLICLSPHIRTITNLYPFSFGFRSFGE